MSTITLAVDVLNNATLVNKVFTKLRSLKNGLQTVLFGPDHTSYSPDLLSCTVSDPKPNGNFKGVVRPIVKRSTTVSVAGVDDTTTISTPLIGTINFSVPVGVTAAQVMELRQDLIAVLDNDSIMDGMMLQSVAPLA